MGSPITEKDHYERINKVLLYVQNHMHEKLDLEYLASISNYSRYHFHRITRAYLNESLGAFITRVRLETSAHLLRLTGTPVSEIAMKVGYDNPPSFNKAFKKRFGISPVDYRRDKQHEIAIYGQTLIHNIMENISLKPKMKNIKPRKIIYVLAKVAFNECAKEAWEKICAFAGKKKLYGFKTEFIGISYDDPTVTEPEKLRYEACITVSKDVEPDGEMGVKEIAGGKYAVFTHKGSYEKFNDSYGYIYGKWVPENNIQLRDAPSFEKYLNSPDKTKPEKLVTEIYIPVA